MALHSQDFLERVRAANDLSQIAASYGVQLKRAGSNMLGLCPFHNEKTPSFNIRPAEQFFRCFGCGAKGDVFRFVQMMEKVEFPEAIRLLAERAGLALEFSSPEAGREAARAGKTKTSLLWCCSRALDYFTECLAGPGGAPAREYLAGRGFTPQTIERWRLGWAPDSWDGLLGFLLKSAKEPGQKEQVEEYARQAGLLRAREDDSGRRRSYDAFRGRVMFPILDSQSRPIAFGGRVLVEKPEAGGKYINSPEGRLFEKRKVLFGLTQAAKEIALAGTAVIVEGYTDVIMCHQYGIANVVATLGTALTEEHAALLRRHVQDAGKVVAFFDSDSAGEAATLRALSLFMAEDVPLYVAGRLELKDAGEFLPKYGADAFRTRITAAEDSFTYLVKRTIGRAARQDPVAVGLAVREAMKIINLCPDAVKRSLMRRRVAAEAGVPEDALPAADPPSRGFARRAGGTGRPVPPTVAGVRPYARPAERPGLVPSTETLDARETLQRGAAARRRREARLLRYMWENADWCARVADLLPPDEWRDEALAELAAYARDAWSDGTEPTINAARGGLQAADADERLADLSFPDSEPLSEKDLTLSLEVLLDEDRREVLRRLRERMTTAEAAGDGARAEELLAEYTALQRQRKR